MGQHQTTWDLLEGEAGTVSPRFRSVSKEATEAEIKLQRQVEDLQSQLAKSKTVVPGVIGLGSEEAGNNVKEKGLFADIKLVVIPEGDEDVVFDQSPAAGVEVE